MTLLLLYSKDCLWPGTFDVIFAGWTSPAFLGRNVHGFSLGICIRHWYVSGDAASPLDSVTSKVEFDPDPRS